MCVNIIEPGDSLQPEDPVLSQLNPLTYLPRDLSASLRPIKILYAFIISVCYIRQKTSDSSKGACTVVVKADITVV